ncbi:MAG: dihydroorotate dehydrogenase [Candidatus Omnitrophica bacterium]|nr:dihydroorotate dehydrogenase [Candidatus Omnitrophota bacterium]
MAVTADLAVRIGKLTLQNPVMVASGTFGYGQEYHRLYDVNALGGIVTKSISLKPRPGNPAPRIYETPSGMLNSIGLQNVGLEAFLKEKLPFLKRLKGPRIIVNLAGESVREYVDLARRLEDAGGIDGLELNISCPNCERGGIEFGVDPRLTAQVVGRVRRVTRRTLIAKLSPNVTDIAGIARAAAEAGADALSLINTLLAIAVDADRWRPRVATVTCGLSGPAIKPVALRMVWQVHRALPRVPLIGIGGIMRAEDAVEFMLCGATAVEVGTANYVNPKAPLEIIRGLRRYLSARKLAGPRALVGKLAVPERLRGIPQGVAG